MSDLGGTNTSQSSGNIGKLKVHDQTTALLLEAILISLRKIEMHLSQVSGMELDDDDVEQTNLRG